MDRYQFQQLVEGRKSEQKEGYESGKSDTKKLILMVGKRNAGFDLINSEFSEAIDCNKGCAHCCHLFVDVMSFEAIAIHQYVRRMLSPQEQKIIVDKVVECYDELKGQTIEEEQKLIRKCPLLNDEGKCRVYPVRPSNCAGMVSPDSNLCEEWKMTGDDIQMETPGKIANWRAVEMQALKSIADEHGDSVESFSLIRALHALFENPALVQRWKKNRSTNLGPSSPISEE